MAQIKISLKGKLNRTRLVKKILEQAALKINSRIVPKRGEIKRYIKDMIRNAIINAPEAEALRDNGTLAAQFGIALGSGSNIVNEIANEVAANAYISIPKARRLGYKLVFNIKIGIVLSGYSDVLGLPVSHYTSQSASKNGDGEEHEIYWLEWLLIGGDGIINKDYGVLFRRGSRSMIGSRSGNALMRKLSGNFKNPFRISPSEFTGLEKDNWLTRSFTSSQVFIQNLLSYIKLQVTK